MNNHPRRAIISWCFFDWAISAFFSVVITFIFAAYFSAKIAPNAIAGTHAWGDAIAIAGLIIAITSPFVGAIADFSGHRKRWLFCFTYLGIISTALLWFAYPNERFITLTLALVILSDVGFEIAFVFYNSLLITVAPKEFIGRISGWAWGMGYAGGLICLNIALFGFVKHPPAFLNSHTAEEIRICGPLIALWITVFSLPLFLWVKEKNKESLPIKSAIRKGLSQLRNTLKTLPQHKNLLRFLIAQMIYMDGLNTLFAFGGIYAAGTFHMALTQVIEFGILLNITAGIGAASFAWIDDILGPKVTISISLIALISLGLVILTIHSQLLFWIFAPLIGIFVGPTQAASRSCMARIAPPEQITELFGMYALAGKATSFVGPWLVATLTYLSNSQRIGMSVIFIFFMIGGWLLRKVEVVN